MSTPSPFTVTKDGSHFEVKVDAHYVSDEEAEIVSRYIATLNDENAKLRELVRDMADAIVDWYDLMDGAFACDSVYEDEKFAPLFDRMRELGVDV